MKKKKEKGHFYYPQRPTASNRGYPDIASQNDIISNELQEICNWFQANKQYIASPTIVRKGKVSGVATGWQGWTMSRGPWAKGAPERERPKKKEERKKVKKRKEKRGKGRKERREKKRKNGKRKKRKERTNLFKYQDGGPTRISPWVLSRWQTIPKSNIGNHHKIFEIWDKQWELGHYVFFFQLAWHLKFSPIRSFNRPQFPMLFQEFPIFPLHHQRAPNFPFRHRGPPISSSCHQNDDL